MARANRPLSLSILMAALTVALQAEARAQTRAGRLGGGVGLSVALPQDEFRAHTDVGVGLNAFLLWHFGERSPLGLRLEGLLIDYGGERRPLSVGGSFSQPDLRADTDHLIVAPLIGPHVGARRGDVRPYLSLGVGPSFFVTTEEVEFRGWHAEYEGLGSSTVFSDEAFAWVAGGGIWVRVGGDVFLTLSAQYMSNSRVEYLAEGLIRHAGAGFLEIQPVESRVNLVVLQVGVSGLVR